MTNEICFKFKSAAINKIVEDASAGNEASIECITNDVIDENIYEVVEFNKDKNNKVLAVHGKMPLNSIRDTGHNDLRMRILKRMKSKKITEKMIAGVLLNLLGNKDDDGLLSLISLDGSKDRAALTIRESFLERMKFGIGAYSKNHGYKELIEKINEVDKLTSHKRKNKFGLLLEDEFVRVAAAYNLLSTTDEKEVFWALNSGKGLENHEVVFGLWKHATENRSTFRRDPNIEDLNYKKLVNLTLFLHETSISKSLIKTHISRVGSDAANKILLGFAEHGAVTPNTVEWFTRIINGPLGGRDIIFDIDMSLIKKSMRKFSVARDNSVSCAAFVNLLDVISNRVNTNDLVVAIKDGLTIPGFGKFNEESRSRLELLCLKNDIKAGSVKSMVNSL